MHFSVELHIIRFIDDNSIEGKKKDKKTHGYSSIDKKAHEHFEYFLRCYSCHDDNINV